MRNFQINLISMHLADLKLRSENTLLISNKAEFEKLPASFEFIFTKDCIIK